MTPAYEDILKYAERQNLELRGVSREQLKLDIAAWCWGSRY